MLWVLSHKTWCTAAKKKTGSVSKHTFKFYKSGSVPHKSNSEETYPKNKVVINFISKINDVHEVFQYTGVEYMSFYQVLISWPVVQANTEDSNDTWCRAMTFWDWYHCTSIVWHINWL